MTGRQKIYVAAAVLTVLAAICAFVAGRYYVDNKKTNFTEKYVLYVYPDMTADQVLDSLQANAGVIRPKSLKRCFDKIEVASEMKPGRYVVDDSCTGVYVARMLAFGWQTPQKLTLSGTMRSKGRIAQKVAAQMMVDSSAVGAALNDAAFIAYWLNRWSYFHAFSLLRLFMSKCYAPTW